MRNAALKTSVSVEKNNQ